MNTLFTDDAHGPERKWTLPVRRVKGPEPYRFMTKVAVGAPDECWEWKGGSGHYGYGTFSRNREPGRSKVRNVVAHRFAYELFVGPIPDGMQIDHLCRNRGCVNPTHLEPVTPEENKRRGESILAINARKTHCKWGHEFTPDNTRVVHLRNGRTGRHCLACHKLRKRGIHPSQAELESRAS